MSNTGRVDPIVLDAARRDWLANLARMHGVVQSVQTALAYGRGAWKCGEYDLALSQFQWAHAANPDDENATLALLHAASSMARFDIESETLDVSSRRKVDSALLSLHRALKTVPGALARARRLLDAHRGDPVCAQFDAALGAIEAGDPSRLTAAGDTRALARDDSLRWAMRHARSAEAHVGLPVDVLMRGLGAAPVRGLTIECGVYFGRSLRVIAAQTRGDVHGFDSFQGLPEAWNVAEHAGAYSTAGRLPDVPPNVSLHTGWFEDTLPPFFAAHGEPIRFLHIDCDLYSSTQTVLAAARAHLTAGSVLVFDDLLGYPGFEAHELKAWEEFTAAHDVRWELLAACLLGREVAVRIESI